jgi:hypothetical protein
MATVLKLHAGGTDPAEIARTEVRAADAMRDLAEVMPPSDEFYEIFPQVARVLGLRKILQELERPVHDKSST